MIKLKLQLGDERAFATNNSSWCCSLPLQFSKGSKYWFDFIIHNFLCQILHDVHIEAFAENKIKSIEG